MSGVGVEPTCRPNAPTSHFDAISDMPDKNKKVRTRPALLNNRRYIFVSVIILHRNVLASVVRHERRRHKADYRAGGDVDGNRVA
jgi:hypothetical protein